MGEDGQIGMGGVIKDEGEWHFPEYFFKYVALSQVCLVNY